MKFLIMSIEYSPLKLLRLLVNVVTTMAVMVITSPIKRNKSILFKHASR